MLQLDHIMYGVRDLQAGVTEIEDRTGVRATFGGFHPGNGTCNALVSLGARQYLEIIAPDPEQGLGGTLGESLTGQRGPRIRTWAVAAPDLEAVSAILSEFDMESRIVDMSRTRPDGVLLNWRVLFAGDHDYGDLLPFFIDWLDSSHPADDAPGGCQLVTFRVSLAPSEKFAALMDRLGIGVEVIEDDHRAMSAVLDSPNGPVELLSD